jgi:DNA-directed RNA polymerase specialized sigma24 family protein
LKAKPYFREEVVQPLVLEWQRTQDPTLLEQIVDESLQLIDVVIRFYRFDRQVEHEELRQECCLKLIRCLPSYDPTRGRVYTLLEVAMRHFCIAYCQSYRRRQEPLIPLEPNQLQAITPPDFSLAFWQPLTQLRTRFHTPELLHIQRRILSGLLANLQDCRPSKGRLLRQIYAEKHPLKGRPIQQQHLELLYHYLLIQLRLLYLEEYQVPSLSCPQDPRLARIWKILGPETYSRWYFVFQGIGTNCWVEIENSRLHDPG